MKLNKILSTALSFTLWATMSVCAEDLLDLESFKDKKGWSMVVGGAVNPTKSKEFTLKHGAGNVFSNGKSKIKAAYLTTSKEWGDHEINAEFMIPKDSNSGFYVFGRYEIQILDSYGKKDMTISDMGSLYQRWSTERKKQNLQPGFDGVGPLVNAALPYGEWQTINIKFRAPRFDQKGDKISHAHFVQVAINGKIVQKSINAKGPTRAAPLSGEKASGPLAIQGNHGPILLRKLSITTRDYSDIQIPKISEGKPAGRKPAKVRQIDLVKLGEKAFTNRGCIECHASFADSNTIKTGPSLYGLFQKKAVEHTVFDAKLKQNIKKLADKSYFTTSLVNPTKHLSIQTQQTQIGKPYMPLMPPYTAEIIPQNEVDAIFHYLLTLNSADKAGPKVVLADAEEVKVSKNLHSHVLVVGERTMVTRGFIDNQTSAKSVHVGQANGQSFSFDPRSLAIQSIWSNGFLDMRNEVNGRGTKASKLAASSEIWPRNFSSILRPQNADGSTYDSPLTHSITPDALKRSTSFTDQLKARNGKFLGYETTENNPTFHYTLDGNKIELNFSVESDGTLNARLTGTLKRPLTLSFPQNCFNKVSVSGGELNVEKGTWKLTSLKTPLQWTAIPQSPIATEPVKQKSRIKSSPFAWADDKTQMEVIAGYSVMRANGPVYADGVSPLFEPTAIDFEKDGTPVIGSRASGIWKIKNGEWRPFALGTHEVLGLSVNAEGDIIVCQKPEVTIIKDTDKDGIADVFQTLSADFRYTGNYHAYNHGPAVDSKGNIHFTLNLQHVKKLAYKAGGRFMGSQGGFRGWNCQITNEGEFSPYAMGFRSAAGIAFSPDEHLYISENQGEFVGTSRIHRVTEGKFYGHPSSLIDLEGMSVQALESGQMEDYLEKRELPSVLLPHKYAANSPGHPVWDTTQGAFGPYSGQMFIGDQTLSNILRVHLETVEGVEQGSIMPFATKLPSGPMRLSFSPDGTMWVGQTGRGWASRGNAPSALQKFKWNGKVEQGIHHVSVEKGGFAVHFNIPVVEADRASYNLTEIDSWFYQDSKNYGSPELDQRNETFSAPVWNEDGSRVLLALTNFGSELLVNETPNATSRVFRINLSMTAFGNENSAFLSTAYYTLNRVPKN